MKINIFDNLSKNDNSVDNFNLSEFLKSERQINNSINTLKLNHHEKKSKNEENQFECSAKINLKKVLSKYDCKDNVFTNINTKTQSTRKIMNTNTALKKNDYENFFNFNLKNKKSELNSIHTNSPISKISFDDISKRFENDDMNIHSVKSKISDFTIFQLKIDDLSETKSNSSFFNFKSDKKPITKSKFANK